MFSSETRFGRLVFRLSIYREPEAELETLVEEIVGSYLTSQAEEPTTPVPVFGFVTPVDWDEVEDRA